MEHIYKNIDGWFNFSSLYNDMVNYYDNATFVEVGCWKGRSAAYMAVEIINSGKNIEFYCVDSWKGDAVGGVGKIDVYEEFLQNMQPVIDRIKIIRELSVITSCKFENKSLDFVFIDASHDYESVKQDINAWFPKIKPGGTLAGHDYHIAFGVKKAVDEWGINNNAQINTDYNNVWFAKLLGREKPNP